MSDTFTLEAQPREDVGKGASRRLRREGLVPAVIYGGDRPPLSVTMSHNEVDKSLANEAFYSHILTLTVDGKDEQAIIKDVQRHPYRRAVQHLDFQRILADQEISVNVPVHFLGEDVCVGVKSGGGTVSHVQSEVAVTCLPRYLPEYLEVDVSHLDVGDSVHLSDIVVPEGVTITELTYGEEHDTAVATVQILRIAEEVEEEGEVEEGEIGEEGAEPQAGAPEEPSGDAPE
jgi:large subunit ribosomal protein L25